MSRTDARLLTFPGEAVQERRAVSSPVLQPETRSELDRFLKRTARKFSGDSAILARVEADGGQARTIATTGSIDPIVAELVATTVAASLRLESGAAELSQPRCVTVSPSDGHAGGEQLLTAAFAPEASVRLSLTIVRAAGGQAFGRTDAHSMRRTCEWIDDWLRLWWRHERETARGDGLRAAFGQSDLGVIVLDRRANIVDANPAARRCLDDATGLRRLGRTVTTASLEESVRLQTAIYETILTGDQARTAAPTIINIRRPGKRSLAVAVARAHDGMVGRDERDPAVILFITDPESDVVSMVEPACAMYGLTPTETRLSMHLVRGFSLNEAAAQMRIQSETARAYLKQVFQKTGVNRQASLMRLLLTSVVPINTKT